MSKSKMPPMPAKLLEAWSAPHTAGDPIGCLATSFTFDPVHFEEECLGRFIRIESHADEDGPIYLVEREERLARLQCAVAVVDGHHAHGLRSLRWDLIPVRMRRGIQHSKVSVLVWEKLVRVIVASANLTGDGYRRNQEIFGVLEYHEGSEAPIEALESILEFVREICLYGVDSEVAEQPARRRALGLLAQAGLMAQGWGKLPGRVGKAFEVVPVLVGPERPGAFASLAAVTAGSRFTRAEVVSPFFDPAEAGNQPARQIWDMLAQRGPAQLVYHLEADSIPGENRLALHAPKSICSGLPGRATAGLELRRLKLTPSRPLHAKFIWLEGSGSAVQMIGSSNFTSAGLGLGTVQNFEANLAYLWRDSGVPGDSRIESEPIDADIELEWAPSKNTDAACEGELLLPQGFGDTVFDIDVNLGPCVRFQFKAEPPTGWKLWPEDEDEVFLSHSTQVDMVDGWVSVTWTRVRPPSEFRVSWEGAAGYAWWPVNVREGTALPPPEELRNLSLDLLLEILTSAQPLHAVMRRFLKVKQSEGEASESDLDPHRRVDTSSFLLQRTRRISWALAGLKARLERPITSLTSLRWNLYGPTGVRSLAAAICRESRSDTERAFLLVEVAMEVARVEPEVRGTLTLSEAQDALGDMVVELRGDLEKFALDESPQLKEYIEIALATELIS